MTNKAKWIAHNCLLTCLLALGIALVATGTADAALVGGAPNGQIKHYYSYSDFRIGDVVIWVTAPPAICPGGFWVRQTDPGQRTW